MHNTTHNPYHLYEASADRLASAETLSESAPSDVVVTYLCGLSVELILQAIAHINNIERDAKHDLNKWLAKCSPDLADALRTASVRPSWSLVCTTWQNRLRYFSHSEWLKHCRQIQEFRVLKGDDADRLKVFNRSLLEATRVVHNKGSVLWQQKIK